MIIPFTTNNLLEIFNKLSALIHKSGSYELNDELDEIRKTYSTMLHYMVKGVDDPNAVNIYSDLVKRCHVMAQRAIRLTRLQENGMEKYVATAKQSSTLPLFQNQCTTLEGIYNQFSALQESNNRETVLKYESDKLVSTHQTLVLHMFNQIWTSDIWKNDDYASCRKILENDSARKDDICLIVSAITLSLMEMFDEKKLMLLFDAYESGHLEVRMRAIVGITLIIKAYDNYINLFSNIKSRLSLLFDREEFIQDLYLVLMQLQFSKLTDKVSDKMRNDIIPSLVQSGKFMRTEYGLKEIDDYMTQNGENPEWHKGAKDDVAQTKFQEMAELQLEGADVYMSTFIHMKSHAFFQQISNWFMPFNIDHPAVSKVRDTLQSDNQISRLLLSVLIHAPFCNSDKYSFAFMLSNIGKQGQEMIAGNLSGGMSENEMNEHLSDLKGQKLKKSDISRQYIHDLYRFFVIYPYHQQFYNPFDNNQPSFSPLNTTLLAPLLEHEEELIDLGEFFMRKELYNDAEALFQSLHPKEEVEDDASIWQKIGFCQQKAGKTHEALHSYTIAYSLDPDSRWTLKHLARVSFQEKAYNEAEVYYDMLLSYDADNLQYLRFKAECQIQEGNYADALLSLYKMDYLDEGSKEVKEKLALCQLMTANYDKARKLYENLLATNPDDAQTLVNLANIDYLEGNLVKAFSTYSQTYNQLKSLDKGKTRFKRMFVDSAKLLKQLNININRFQMMYDAVVILEE